MALAIVGAGLVLLAWIRDKKGDRAGAPQAITTKVEVSVRTAGEWPGVCALSAQDMIRLSGDASQSREGFATLVELASDFRERRKSLFFSMDQYGRKVLDREPWFVEGAGRWLRDIDSLNDIDPQWHSSVEMPQLLRDRMTTLDLLEGIANLGTNSAAVKNAQSILEEIAARPEQDGAAGPRRLEAAESYDALSAVARVDAGRGLEIYTSLGPSRRRYMFAALVAGLVDGGMRHDDALAVAEDATQETVKRHVD